MTNAPDAEATDAEMLAAAALHELSTGAEALLVIAKALETEGIARNAAVLVRLAALQLTTSAARMLRAAERSRVIAECREG